MNKFKQFFDAVSRWVSSPAAQVELNTAERYVAMAAPYIAIAGVIVSGVTPTALDDEAIALLRSKYPQLFDGTQLTPHMLKLIALGVAGDLMQWKFPRLSTSVARTAVQVAYLGQV